MAERVVALSRNITFAPGGLFSPDEIAKALRETARAAIAEVDAKNAATARHPLPHVTHVDGAEDQDLMKVKPTSTIVAEWPVGMDVVAWIFEQIKYHSPVLTGRYKASHRIFADGVEVSTPEDTISAREVIITTDVPYARKLEGKKARNEQGKKEYVTKPSSSSAQNGVYEAVAALATARFNNIAKIKYAFREISAASVSAEFRHWAVKNSLGVTAKRRIKKRGEITWEDAHATRQRKRLAKNLRQPAIYIGF